MSVKSVVCLVFDMTLAGITLLPAARADDWNQMNKLSFSSGKV